MGKARPHRRRAGHAGVRLRKLDDADSREDDAGDYTPPSSPTRGAMAVAELAPTFAYSAVPDEILVGDVVDLSVWSVVATDACLLRLGGRQAVPHPNQLMAVLSAVADGSQRPPPPTVRRLSLRHAEQISDVGLRTVASRCVNLTSLDLSHATHITDAGLRHLLSCCRLLEELHLSHVPALRGAALTTVADCQLPLRILSVAGCPQVPDFAMQRVFQRCAGTLRQLDLSFNGDSVDDATLLSLARYGVKLTSLRLRGCRQLSDSGLVHTAASSLADLDALDLTRSDLAYRLTDVALLAIGDHCRVLRSLQLRGCSALSDVGVSWLTRGCAALTALDLGGVARLTDVGLRAIGEQLLQLRHLSLSNCVRVSDLGLRHLTRGCPDLERVDLSGLTLLSDGGVAAFVGHQLQYLDVARCAGVGDAMLVALARQAPTLKELVASGCRGVTSSGVKELLRHCKRLELLALQDCERVDDAAFLGVGALPRLATLRLRGCLRLSDTGVRSIAHCHPPLAELDLSNCERLSDLSVLALTESGAIAASLRRLSLRGVRQLTGTALSWLASKCPWLLSLDLQCNSDTLRSSTLPALASSWKLAQLSPGRDGLVPIHRAQDRLFLEEYGESWRAATKLQSVYRARVARREAARRREEKLRVWVATRLQSVVRGRRARREVVIRRLVFQQETEAARRVQRRWRQRSERRREQQRKQQWRAARQAAAATRIQLAWRRARLHRRLQVRELARRAAEQRRHAAATLLQRRWRGKRERDRVSVLRAAKLVRDREQAEAAAKMQSMYRARAARREAQARREQKEMEAKTRERAARLVQSHVRRRRAQREFGRLRDGERRRQQAATCIQRRWRRKKRSVALQLVAIARQRQRENAAAVRLQAAWKRKKGRDAMKLLRVLKHAQRQQEVEAATKLQTIWRGKRARRQVASAKQAALDRVLAQLRLEHRSAALVQAHFRGRRGRREYQALLLQRKQQRWKRVEHPDTGKPFYYNKETGEVRFRCPQDVLDLLPRPACDNCVAPAVSDAQVECLECEEVYCNQCFGHVHAGGRRKGHAFRVLYDYYGKRVDYGDGEFPSRWPTEIQQDEMDGWALRTFPMRQPVETRGAWEKYADDSREWFYNKQTEANTYSEPPEWDPAKAAKPSASQSATEVLSGDWAKYDDPASGYSYYYNARTGESTYTRPVEFLTPRENQAAAERSADGWAKYVDAATGYSYYYHASTGESTYDRPATFLTPRRGQAPLEAAGSDGWAKYFDVAQGVYYYYHAASHTSQFERPHAFATPRVDQPTARGLATYVDTQSQRTYAYDAQTTECRAVAGARSLARVQHGGFYR